MISGKDEKQVEKAYALAFRIVEEELARQGSKEKPVRDVGRGHRDDADRQRRPRRRVGATILVSNKAEALKSAIEQATSEQSKPRIHPARRDAAKVLPKGALAWLWLNFAAVKETQAGQGLLRRDAAGLHPDLRRRRDHRLPQALGLPRRRAVPGADRLPARLAHPGGPRRNVGRPRAARSAEGRSRARFRCSNRPATIYSQSFYLDVGLHVEEPRTAHQR